MLAGIVPAGVTTAEAFEDPPDVALFPEERAIVGGAVEKRRREFATARHCARIALGRIGVPPEPILPGARGAPSWPAGVVGSMTHCLGYRAAAVGRSRDLVTIGIDAEPHEVLPSGVLETVALDEERMRLSRLAADAPGVHWDRLLFSAKESVYKAWFPLTGSWLDFAEADVVIDPGAGTFTARLLVPGPVVHGRRISHFTGRYVVRDGLALTAIALPA